MERNVTDDLKTFHTDTVVQFCQTFTLDYSVMMVNNTSSNVGAMIRTANLLGCRHFYNLGQRKINSIPAVGAHHYSSVISLADMCQYKFDHLGNITSFTIDYVKLKKLLSDYTPIIIEHGGIPVTDMKWNVKNPLFILGNEHDGLSPEFCSFLHENFPNTVQLSIPQFGTVRSFNVATAGAIVCWEYVRSNMNSSPFL